MTDEIGLFDAIFSTRSLRRFRADPLPDDVLHRILTAATQAPSGTNSQTWRFLVLRDPEIRRRIGELYREGFDEVYPPTVVAATANPNRRRVLRSARYLADHMGTEPPVLVLVCLERNPGAPSPTPTSLRSSGSSAYPAVQNVLLAARALGVGGCLTTLHLRREAEVKAALGIPDHVDTYALVPLGYPRDRFGPLRRRPVAEVTFAERWGEPAAFASVEATASDAQLATSETSESRTDAAWRGKVGGMSDPELTAFLSGKPLCRLSCVDDDGWPYSIPCWFEYADGGFYVIPRERSAWARYVQREPRVALCIDEDRLPQRRVIVRGEARVLETPNVGGRWVEIAQRMATRYLGEHGPDYLVPTLDEPRWLIFVRPLTVRTWQGVGWAKRYKHYAW